MRLIDLTGKRFGRLTVVNRVGATPKGSAIWACRCDCGSDHRVSSAELRSGGSKSCGCFRRELHFVHGHARHGKKTPERKAWAGMKSRCGNVDHPRYGGRGIRVCKVWQTSFQAFLEHIGPMPRPGMTVERIDNDGHYEPGNVRWATRREQAQNTSRNVEFRGRSQTKAKWAEELGISRFTLQWRLRNGWGIERALTVPVANGRWREESAQ